MNDSTVDPRAVQLLYQLWDGALEGRERVLAWDAPVQKEDALSREDAPDIQQLLRNLNRIGHLLARGVLPEGFAEEIFGKEILLCHGRLEPLLASMRQQREDPGYLEFVDQLAARCKSRWPDFTPKYADPGKSSGRPGFL